MARNGAMYAGLDIGTTKICCVIAQVGEENQIEIIGIGTHPSKGLRKGVVVNIESTLDSIQAAVQEAELMAGATVETVSVGIAGSHIQGFNSHGIIAIKHHEVAAYDVERVIDAAKAVAMPLDREIVHVLPQEFIIDDQDGIKEPLGMAGVRLESKVHIVTGAMTAVQNIIKAVRRANLEVTDVVLEPLASSEAVLTPDERELGVCLIDIGGGTTDLAIFCEDAIKHTGVIGLGGSNVTNDIAIGLRTPTLDAEKIKRKYGCAATEAVAEDDTVEVPSIGGRANRVLSRKTLADIIEPRIEELFSLVNKELMKSGLWEFIPSGVVLTGGASIMDGMVEVAERVFELPVRRGVPIGVGGLIDVVSSPVYATGVGLLMFGIQGIDQGRSFRNGNKSLWKRMQRRVASWFGNFR